MYSDSASSRIAREFFWILKSLESHYRTLLGLKKSDPVRISHLLCLMAIYMLKEEGNDWIRPKLVVEETTLPKSTIYRVFERLKEGGILEGREGEYNCLARTPKFLTNPEELFQRPLAMVKDRDYHIEELIKNVLTKEFQKRVPQLMRDEMERQKAIEKVVKSPDFPVREFPPVDELEEPEDDKDKSLSDELEEGGFML